jgi:nitroreductase
MVSPVVSAEERLKTLLSRRSVSPKRLRAPGPNADELDGLIQAGLRAPDHGGLHPWRIVELRAESRESLALCFEQEKLRRDPLATPLDIKRAREHATRAPMLLGFVVSPQARSMVPLREQWLGAGAALSNILNAAHQLGYGAIVLSGERCFDEILGQQLGMTEGECLAGFISFRQANSIGPCRSPSGEHAVNFVVEEGNHFQPLMQTLMQVG